VTRDEKKLKKHFAQHALGFAVRKQRQKENRLRKAMVPAEPARERYSAAVDDWDELDLPTRERFVPREGAPPRDRVSGYVSPAKSILSPENDAESILSPGVAVCRGVALGLAGGRLRVWCEGRELIAVLPGSRSGVPPAAGDEVMFDSRAGTARVVAIAPRRTELVRPDPAIGARPRVLAANVDTVVIVVPAGPQAPRTGLVDRMLLAIGRTGCNALVCVSKTDLVSSAELSLVLERLSEPGAPLVACSAATGDGLDELAMRLRQGRSVLVGHSGAGKTSLLNALVPGASLATGPLREGNAKGRHTTSAATLIELEGGGQVLDTPGVRQFGLWSIRREDLLEHFADVAEHGRECRFRDCRHDSEPRCAVRGAVERGELPESRYRAYRRLVDECIP
jgi:ribosome biogenesis GTPase